MNQQPPNGNGNRAVALPPTRVKAAELFIQNFQAREDELERAKEALANAEVTIREHEAEIEALKRERLILESRATTCLLERDRAKDDQVSLATILNSIQHLLRQSGVPDLTEQAHRKAEVEEEAGG